MVTIIITIKLFHLFISALSAAVSLDSVNLTETFPVSPSLFKMPLHIYYTLSFFSFKGFIVERLSRLYLWLACFSDQSIDGKRDE